LVYVWLPGENRLTHVLPGKINFNVFGSPPTLNHRRTFAFPESIFAEAALPSFLESSFSDVKVGSPHLSLLPLNLIPFFHIPFYIWQILQIHEKSDDFVCVIFVAAKFFSSFFLEKSQARLKKTVEGWNGGFWCDSICFFGYMNAYQKPFLLALYN